MKNKAILESKINEQINSATSYVEAENRAEKLTYEIQKFKEHDWRARYEYLKPQDLEQFGWNVYACQHANKATIDFFKENKFEPFSSNTLIKNVTKEMFMFNAEIFGIRHELPKLISLDDYKEFLKTKLRAILDKQEALENYVAKLIGDHMAYLETLEDQAAVQQIIQKALEDAKRKGLIKNIENVETFDSPF
jgi:hypothetical protein